MARIPFFGRKQPKMSENDKKIAFATSKDVYTRVHSSKNPLIAAVGMKSLITDTNKLRDDGNYDNDFFLYDDMLKLDPELNGAVRAVSLTANNYRIDYSRGRNTKIREAIRLLVEETVDFDDVMINAMRNLMVYGNDMNKLVGKTGLGITDIQSLPIGQMTIRDDRSKGASVDKSTPIIESLNYTIREGEQTELTFPTDEILHIRIDYRSNWFLDNEGRWTYGVWGASRFTALKQAIRAKYNTINNRVALEDSMTKQYITIDRAAIQHIQDPDEQRERLIYIMDKVVDTLESLRGDQIPIFPDYVSIQHIDQRTALPDSASFLDSVNADIAAVLQVPRVASGQERGSTFAATFNANMWSVQAITRLHEVLRQSIRTLFSKHLELLGIAHIIEELPTVAFEPVAEEGRLDRMRRATLGFTNGVITLNQSLDILGLPEELDGDVRNDTTTPSNIGELPREDSQEGRPTEEEPIPEEGEVENE
tara:strand:- start:13956 stop:15395 length:1440 start_codon:yes stop_codon:yes gene_type:complete